MNSAIISAEESDALWVGEDAVPLTEEALAIDEGLVSSAVDRGALMAMVRYFGRLRKAAGVWPLMIHEILSFPDYNIGRLAQETQLSTRTLKRILCNKTQLPNFQTSYRLFHLHYRLCPHHYVHTEEGILWCN